MATDCIVHVGDMKCGSKAIQHWLCRNEDQLREKGFAVSRELRVGCYHSFLSSYALDDHRVRNVSRSDCNVLHSSKVPAHRVDVRKRLSREIAGLPANVHTVIFSHEQLLSLRPREVARVVELLRQHFSGIRVVAYIRRQDRQFVSSWGQKLKTGMPSYRFYGRLRRKWRYLRMLQTWETCVGHEAIAVRIFDRRDFHAGCIVKDFCHTLGIPWGTDFHATAVVNESLGATAQRVLLASHRIWAKRSPLWRRCLSLFAREKASPARAQRLYAIVAFLTRKYPGRGLLPPRGWAQELMAAFAQENEAIRTRYLPDKPQLFDDGFDEYPEDGSPPLSAAEALEIAGTVLECFIGVPSAELITEAYELVLGRLPTAAELSEHSAAARSITDVYKILLEEAGIGRPPANTRIAA